MKLLPLPLRNLKRKHILFVSIFLGLFILYAFKLGTLPPGMSGTENLTTTRAVGWSGLFADPLYFPVDLLRSIVFFLQPDHGALLTRISSVPFGIAAVAAFYLLLKNWYGTNIAVLSSLLFATSAWTLHVSRLASYDVLYFAATPILLLTHITIRKYYAKSLVYLACICTWLFFIFVPGLYWAIFISMYLQREFIISGWAQLKLWQKAAAGLASAGGVALLLVSFLRPNAAYTWLGLPETWGSTIQLLKQLASIPVHMYIRGPHNPELWLSGAPILDLLAACLSIIGVFFFVTRFEAFRSKLLIGMLLLSSLFVGLRGPVGISLLVPLFYIFVATGLAYYLREWLRTFPKNPVIRTLGISLIAIAVSLSSVYNLRAYFVAWMHADATQATFRYHR